MNAEGWRVPTAAAQAWESLMGALLGLEGAPACADEPELWWSRRPEQTAAAQVVCALCPVVAVCRAYVLAAGDAEREGVWGGLAPEDRS